MLKTFHLVADLGNYELKFWDGDRVRAIRAIQVQIPQGRRPLEGKPNSPLIEYQGQLWHFGAKAYEYRRQAHTVEGDKHKTALLSVLACCDFPTKEFELSIHTSHPTPEVVRADIEKQLLGCHVFSRNNRSHIVHVKDVIVDPEGFGAWKYAQKEGLIPPYGYTVLIDLGGGTWISRLMNASGEIIDQSIDIKGGVFDLATSISFDDRLIRELGTRPHPGVILDGFADGSHYYGEMPQASWQSWFEKDHLNSWFSGIIQAVKSQYEPQRSRIVKFVLAGGGSLLVADKVSHLKGFAVIPNPRFANVLGLLSKDQKVKVA